MPRRSLSFQDAERVKAGVRKRAQQQSRIQQGNRVADLLCDDDLLHGCWRGVMMRVVARSCIKKRASGAAFSALANTWATIATALAPASGLIEYADFAPLAVAGFYQVVLVP